MKILKLLEAREPKTQAGFERSNQAAAKRQHRELEKALQRAILDGDDDRAAELRDAIKDCKAELNESVDKEAIKARIQRLRDDLKEMPKNPNSGAGIEAVEEIRNKIHKLEQQLKESVERTATADEQYAARKGEVDECLARLKEGLEQHAAQAQENPGNWGYADELDEVLIRLNELKAILGISEQQ